MSKEDRGSTLIEMMGVITIVGVLAAGAWLLISSAMGKYRISATMAQLHSLQKGITRFYAADGNYNNLNMNDLIANRVPPVAMIHGDKLHHPFGDEVEIDKVSYSDISEYGSSSDSFTITFKGLKKKACAELASISWVEHDSVNLVSIQVGNDKYEWPSFNDDSSAKLLPVTEAKAMTSCVSGNDNGVDITWEFR